MTRNISLVLGFLVVLVVVALLLNSTAIPDAKRAPVIDESSEPTSAAVPVMVEPGERSRVVVEDEHVDPDSVRISVIDAVGRTPVPGAVVKAWSRQRGAYWAGETDQGGQGSVPWSPDSYVIATKDGFTQGYAQMSRGDAEVVLEIRRAGSIRGCVIAESAGVDLGGLQVIGWSDSVAAPSPLSIVDALDSGIGIVSATTAPDGCFVLEGIDENDTYFLAAGGRGLTNSTPVVGVSTRTTNLQVLVWQAHAALVRVKTAENVTLRANDRSDYVGNEVGAFAGKHKGKIQMGTSFGVYLTAPELSNPDSEYRLVCAATPMYSQPIMDVTVVAGIPGYQSAMTSVSLQPIDREIPRFDLGVIAAESVGDVRIVFRRRSAEGPENSSTPAFVPDGTVRLSSLSDPRRTYFRTVRGTTDRADFVVRGVPCDEYLFSFESTASSLHANKAAEMEPVRVFVQPQGADVEWWILETGGARIRFGVAGQSPWWATELAVGIVRGKPEKRGEELVLANPKFVNMLGANAVLGLEPGAYTMFISWAGKKATLVDVEIVSGQVADVELK